MFSIPMFTHSRLRTLGVLAVGVIASVGSQPVQAELGPTEVKNESVTVLYGPSKPDLANPPPSALRFPFAVEFDPQGKMVIAEYTGGRVLRQNGEQLDVIAGIGEPGYAGDGGPATEAAFHDLHNLAITENGDIYLSDHENHSVRKIDAATGVVSSFAGNGKPGFGGDGGQASDARFNQVMCVTLTPDKRALLVTDLKNRRIRSIDLASGVVTTIAGNGQKGVPQNGALATEAPLVDPRAAAMDQNGNLYIVERNGNALRRVDPTGKIFTVAGTGAKGKKDGPALSATMWGPKHLAIDESNRVYLADDMNHLIRRYDPIQRSLTTLLGDKTYKLNRPHGVTIHEGDLYVADSWNHRILKMPVAPSE